MRRREFLFLGSGVAIAGAARAAGLPMQASAGDDMDILEAALALHPGLHRYLSPDDYAAALQRLRHAYRAETGLATRYLALSRFLAAIRCGHSYCNFFNQKTMVADALFDRPTRLPFHFAWVGDAMVVTRGFDTGLPVGSVVETLDGRSPVALRRQLMPYVRADGHNDAKRVSLLEVRGDDAIETFDVFQGLLAPPADGVHRLLVRQPEGASRRIEVAAIGLAARKAQIAVPTAANAPAWTWTMREDGIAVLGMPGWALWDSKWDWKAWLDERLDGLDGARGLVVDLRDNEGGDDCGDRILARLIDAPFEPSRIEQRLRFQRTPATLDPYLDTWDDSFRTLGVGAAPLEEGFYLRPGARDALRIEPAGRRLRLPLRVLTSPVNSSATFQFASNVRALGVGKLVGRATGGNRRGINGGCFFFVRLPGSGIEFDLPLVGYFPTTPQPDAGLMPDIMAAPSVDDIAAGRDVALQAAVESILG
ncbi:MAG TPA: S41 family peptidase [Thermomonas sp.]|nr:S41 family peptidase [Thermomonas sp.]